MDELIALSQAALARLPDNVRVPNYDRANLWAGIVHIGLGNFHRAHQAWYLHRLLDQGLCHDWAIIGAGVRPNDAAQRDKLLAQDCLTTLIELDPSGKSAEICGSMIDYIPVEDGNAALIECMSDPKIRIVSLTITEGGYYIDPASGSYDATHPDILFDAANPQMPRTAFGAMIAALRHRRDSGHGPFTGQSCDNLQDNGNILRQTIVSLARMSDPDLADWIDVNCSFPNSVVDSIVPATGTREIAFAHEFGIDDAVPVTHERFRQWIIEDDFCAGRPDWDRAGATFTDRVQLYEAMKLRILNAGHQILANTAEILGIQTIAQAMEHSAIHAMFRKVELDEIVPHVISVPGITPEQYVDLVDRRFSNSAIVDTTRRVAYDGSSRHTGFVLPSVRDALKSGAPIDGLALVEAAWARMCQGRRQDGSRIDPNDPSWNELQGTALEAKSNPRAWLEMRQFYGDLAAEPRFADAFQRWLGQIWEDGIEAAVNAYLVG